MLYKRLQTPLQREKTCSMLSYYSLDNIAQVKSFCNVVQETPGNIAQKKFLLNVVLILWNNIAQVKFLCNVVQEAPDSIAQEKTLFNVVVILFGTTLHK